MPLLPYITQPLQPERFYHIYNRGNEQGTYICYGENNYHYFLRKLWQYMTPYLDVYAYCILQDHYHLAVRVKAVPDILRSATRDLKVIRKDAWERMLRKLHDITHEDTADLAVPPTLHIEVSKLSRELPNLSAPTPRIASIIPILPEAMLRELASWAVSERMRRFHLGYTKAINKQRGRRGSLMQKPFRRKELPEVADMKRLIRYIHHNPIHHRYVSKMEDYRWSSYNSYVSMTGWAVLSREEVLRWYGGIDAFKRYHSSYSHGGKAFEEPEYIINKTHNYT